MKKIYHYKGDGSKVEDTVYTPKQFDAVKLAKGSKLEEIKIKVSKNELKLMSHLAGIIGDTSKDKIVRGFITNILNDEF